MRYWTDSGGPHTYDRFASYYNRKCENFNSKFWCKQTSGVDTFKQSWAIENNWFVPPPTLICQTVKKVLNENVSGTLIIPEWKSAPFWPIVWSGSRFKKFVKSLKYFEGNNVTHRGRDNNGIFGQIKQKFRFVALRIEW